MAAEDSHSVTRRLALTVLVAAGGVLLPFLLGRYAVGASFCLAIFLLADLFAIMVSFSVFAVGWYAPVEQADPRIRVLGAAFLAVGLLHVLHTLTYPAMPLLVLQPSPERAVLFRLAARFIAAAGLLLAAFGPREWLRRLPGAALYVGALAYVAATAILISWAHLWMSYIYVPGEASAKPWVEALVLAAFVTSGVAFWRERLHTGSPAALHFAQAAVFLTFRGIAFIPSHNLFDTYHLVARVFKVLGFYQILQGAYVTNVRLPYENLKGLVAQRTAELERALAELKRADRLKDEFISMASHELKTPITSLKLLSQLAMRHPEQVTPDFMDRLDRQTAELMRLVNDLLEVSRLQMSSVPLQRERLDLLALVRDVCHRPVPSYRVIFCPGEEDAALPVEGDPLRLAQIFSNLIDNAVKYSQEGGRIWVRTSRAGGRALVEVQDEGLGIAPEDLPHVFERFYKPGAGQTAYPGLGLGLYISKEYAERHGGRIWAESELGKGSTFYVELPLAPEGYPR